MSVNYAASIEADNTKSLDTPLSTLTEGCDLSETGPDSSQGRISDLDILFDVKFVVLLI